MMEEDLWWETTFDGRWSSMEDEWGSETLRLRDIETPNFFRTQNFFRLSTFFRPKTFSDQMFFFHKIFFPAKKISNQKFSQKLRNLLRQPQMTKSTHIYQIKPIKTNLSSQIYQTKPPKLSLLNQTNKTNSTKPNLQNQTKPTKPNLTLIRQGGGANGPPGFKSLISREPKVGLTSNQAVNLSLSVV